MPNKILTDVNVKSFQWCGAKVYLIEDIQSVPMSEVERLMQSLPQWRREKVLAMKSDGVRRESVMAFTLLMTALRQDFHVEDEIEFVYNEQGKPRLTHHPDIYFNISHCQQAVACVIANREVGVDVERRGRYKETLARHILSDEEWQRLERSEQVDLDFTILWTKKEAVLKKTGTGISGGMKRVLEECGKDDIKTYVSEQYVCSVAI